MESARADLSGQITRFQATGRETFDIKTQLSRLPGRIKEIPKRYAADGAAVAGTIFGLRFLRGGRRKAQAGTLPVEVEEALAGMGKDSDKIRKALDQSFVRYLEAHGAVEPAGARLSRNVALVLVPVATTVIREALKRGAPQKAAAAMRERRGGGGGGPTDPEV